MSPEIRERLDGEPESPDALNARMQETFGVTLKDLAQISVVAIATYRREREEERRRESQRVFGHKGAAMSDGFTLAGQTHAIVDHMVRRLQEAGDDLARNT